MTDPIPHPPILFTTKENAEAGRGSEVPQEIRMGPVHYVYSVHVFGLGVGLKRRDAGGPSRFPKMASRQDAKPLVGKVGVAISVV